MTPKLEQALSGYDAYDTLPVAVRDSYTVQEWLWLSDWEKATLVRRECEPEETE